MTFPYLTVESSPARQRGPGARLVRWWRAHWRTHGRHAAGAMTATGAGALASGLASALSSKILATVGGPGSIALLATLQQARQGGLIAASFNGQAALIQGSSARTGIERREYVRTAALLFLLGVLAVSAACLGFPSALRHIAGLAALNDRALAWVAMSIALASAFLFLTSILNALGRIRTLAALQIVSPASLAVGMAVLIHAAGRAAEPLAGRLPLLVAISAVIPASAAAVALLWRWAQWREWVRGPGKRWSQRAAREFLSISGALLASGLIATGALLAVRGRMVATAGLAATGCFDAAWTISMNHASLLVASLQTYCLPALARARSAREQSEHVSSVLLLAMPAAAAVIAAIAIAKPMVIGLLYTPAFGPAAELLRWTLAGDYLKIGSWILSLPLLARADMKAFLLLDAAAYAAFAAAPLLFSHWLPAAESAAAAFVLMYAVHLGLAAALSRWRCGIRIAAPALIAWGAGALVTAAVSAFTWNRI